MKIATIVGARPQFIKAAVVSRALSHHPGLTEVLIHTGQHHDDNMSDVFFREMGIPDPGYNLGIKGGSHGQMTGRQIEAVEATLMSERPDLVLVYGDTNSTMAGALAATKLHIPVAHVEAGLRSFNRRMPEEINRVVTDHVSTLLFAPSATAVRNLAHEGIAPAACHFVGDVMYDAALHYGTVSAERSGILASLGLETGGFRVATVHRQENTDDLARLTAIFAAFRTLAQDARMVVPLHPRTRKVLVDAGLWDRETLGLDIVEPVGFFDMIELLRHARLVLTDSGGLQKEAYFHGTPVVILRDETEWTELLDIGWARLAPPVSAGAILDAAGIETMPSPGDAQPYGNGHAGEAIAAIIAGA